jgi:hypothetical protein
LVRAERRDVGLGAASADGHRVKRAVEEGHLMPRRRSAAAVRGASRVDGLEGHGQRYQEHALLHIPSVVTGYMHIDYELSSAAKLNIFHRDENTVSYLTQIYC